MGRKRKNAKAKEKARKRVKVEFVERKDGASVYNLLDQLIEKDHSHLSDANVAIAWVYEKKPDPDGLVYMGDAKKGTDLDRELHGYDWVILLPHELWNSAEFKEETMRALLDHLLCKCMVLNDMNGEPKIDERGRVCYRKRKPLGVFSENVARYGLWHEDLENLARQIHADNAQPLFKGEHEPVAGTINDGKPGYPGTARQKAMEATATA